MTMMLQVMAIPSYKFEIIDFFSYTNIFYPPIKKSKRIWLENKKEYSVIKIR
jgi:hypothetical protein